MKIFIPFISLLLAFTICYKIIPVVIRIAHLKNLVDLPNHRTSHEKAIPTLGGIGIFISFSVVILLFSSLYFIPELNFLLLGMIILFFIGIKDDILVLSPKKKLAAQILVSAIISTLGNVRIDSFQGILGIYEIPYITSVIVSMFVFIALINALNLIDGIDGLASGFSILATSLFGTSFFLLGIYGWAMLAFTMVGALACFFLYNVFGKTNKIFMGDTGSLVIGFFLTTLAFKFIEVNTSTLNPLSIKVSATMALAILFLPIVDTIRVFAIRIARGKSPFTPDKNHLHHLLLRIGLSHKKATLTLLALNVIPILCCLIMDKMNININFILLMLVGLSLTIISVLHMLLVKYEKNKAIHLEKISIGSTAFKHKDDKIKQEVFEKSSYN